MMPPQTYWCGYAVFSIEGIPVARSPGRYPVGMISRSQHVPTRLKEALLVSPRDLPDIEGAVYLVYSLLRTAWQVRFV